MTRDLFLVPLFCLAAAAASSAQTQSVTRGPHRMEITLDRLDGSTWRSVDPGLIFKQGDRVRFRFRSNFAGYLYVTNQSTSGDYTMLFPRKDTGEDNRVEAGREYVVPATQGAFRITGPPGHDVIYWLVSPTELGSPAERRRPNYVPLPPPPRNPKAFSTLTPRCDDTILRARGDCVDRSAGPKELGKNEPPPENWKKLSGAQSRELVFIQQQQTSVVSSPVPLTGPVIYEFRLSHR